MAPILFLLNGPNLNLLGKREPQVYGKESLDDVRRIAQARAEAHGLVLDFRQSNHEGVLVDWIHEARETAAAIVINPGAYTHTSIALLDALLASELPVVELHLSNVFRREPFRHHSYVSLAARGLICGFGAQGYALAVDAASGLIGGPKA